MFKNIKELIKNEAAELKAYKLATKEGQRTKKPEIPMNYWKNWYAMPAILRAKKDEFRSMHIAYSMLRGRTYEQIEKNANTKPNWADVEKYTKRFKEMLEVKNEEAA